MAASAEERRRTTQVTMRTLRYFWGVTRAQWPSFLGAVLSTLGFVFFLTYMNPYLMGLVIDVVSAGDQGGQAPTLQVLAPIAAALICVNVAGQVCSKLQDYFCAKVDIKGSFDLTTQAFDTLSNQSMTFYNNRFGGALVSQVQRFVSAYTTIVDRLTYSVIPMVAGVVFTVCMLLPVAPPYVACLAVLLAIYVLVVKSLYAKILPENARAAAANNQLSGQLSDSITNIMAVKTSGREAYERQRFADANVAVRGAESRRMWANIKVGAVTSSLIALIMTTCTVFVCGGTEWFAIAPGTLVMMFTYTQSLTSHFNMLSSTFQTFNRALGDAHDLTVALGEPLLVADDPGAPDLKVLDGRIDFTDVGFHYPDAPADDLVFDDFNLTIPAGQRVGLVGRSGSGKTTLTSLLLRLADLQEGRILIDDQDIAHTTQTSIRRQIAYVPQEPLLFHRSIADNIAYGRPGATDAEVREAAAKANATEFIERLPDGFQTLVGERGVKLSGGQRQRIAIARAILADAPILVLDEATSALDSESERLIQEALATLMEGRTSLVVAHRLSTVASLDRIVVLADGEIVEDGTHGALVRAGGPYEQLWDRQTGAFLEEG